MDKIDFKKTEKALYRPTHKSFTVLEVPSMHFLMVDGHGTPGNSAYQQALEALYAVAYKVKFTSKQTLGQDYVVPPLEGLWWAEDMSTFTTNRDKSQWDWTMMIRQPDWITQEIVKEQTAVVAKQKDLPALEKLRFATYEEGLSVQIMHIGSYDDEGPTLAKLHHQFMPGNSFTFNGKHHEIYLSDPRRVAPEKMKTVLRQPVKKI